MTSTEVRHVYILKHVCFRAEHSSSEHRNGEPTPLTKERLEALENVHPEWWKEIHQFRFDEYVEDLIAYRNKHGHCNVPQRDNIGLSRFVKRTRTKYKQQMKEKQQRQNGGGGGPRLNFPLSDEQIQRLDDIGFEWEEN